MENKKRWKVLHFQRGPFRRVCRNTGQTGGQYRDDHWVQETLVLGRGV